MWSIIFPQASRRQSVVSEASVEMFKNAAAINLEAPACRAAKRLASRGGGCSESCREARSRWRTEQGDEIHPCRRSDVFAARGIASTRRAAALTKVRAITAASLSVSLVHEFS